MSCLFGGTPLVAAPRLAAWAGVARLRLKLEHAEKLAALQKKFTELLEAQESDEIDGSSA